MSLHLGLSEDDKNQMRMLVNTGAAMNTGNFLYHIWVMSQCPEMVGEFLECGKNTNYDVMYLLAALDLKEVTTY